MRYRKNLKKERFKQRAKRIRRRNKKAVWRRQWFWDFVLGIILVAEIVYVLFFWDMFQVTKVDIKAKNPSDWLIAQKAVEQAQQEKLWYLLPRSSIFLINTEAIKDQVLTQNLAIERLDVSKHLPRKLQIIVNLRQPIFLFCSKASKECFLMDKTGLLFQRHNSTSTTFLTTVTKPQAQRAVGERPLENQEIKTLSEIKAKAEKDIGLKVMGFTIEGKDITMQTGSGWEAYFDSSKDIDWQVLELKMVLDKEIGEEREGLEYIDLRFNKVYYKYK